MSRASVVPEVGGAAAPQPDGPTSLDQAGLPLSNLSPLDTPADTAQSPISLQNSEERLSFRMRTWLSANSIAVAGWVLALISMIVAIISLLPGFNSQDLSKKALELSEWTALKDFIEQCEQNMQAGVASRACKEAVKQPLPPPPHVMLGASHLSQRSTLCQYNGDSSQQPAARIGSKFPYLIVILIVFLILLIISAFFFASFEYDRLKLHQWTRTDGENPEFSTYSPPNSKAGLGVTRRNVTSHDLLVKPFDVEDPTPYDHTKIFRYFPDVDKSVIGYIKEISYDSSWPDNVGISSGIQISQTGAARLRESERVNHDAWSL